MIYFLSDGEPTDPNSSVGINSTEEGNWITFLQSNNVEKVIAVGVGDLNATNAGRLEPIAWSSTETQASSITPPANDPNVLIIDDTDFTQLGATLSATLPNSLSGNVVTESTNGAIPDGFGADGPGAGAGILSITVNGHVYAYGAAANKVTKDGNAFSNGGTLDVDTTLGGHLTFHFTTGSGFNAGDYGYTAPANVNSNQVETFHYVIADGDGDKAEADLKITVQNLNEAPTITSGAAVSVAENTPNTTVVHDAAATDPDGDTITYSLSPGGDNAKFTINSSTGEVRFKTSPNYEAPGMRALTTSTTSQSMPTTATGTMSRSRWRSRSPTSTSSHRTSRRVRPGRSRELVHLDLGVWRGRDRSGWRHHYLLAGRRG